MNLLAKQPSFIVVNLITALSALGYFFLQPDSPVLPEKWLENLYRQALVEHFWEYLSYTPLKPPLFSVLHAGVIHFAGIVGVSEEVAFRTYAAILYVAIAPLLFRTLINFNANLYISAFVALLASLSVSPLIGNPINYDFPIHFFSSLFLYAISVVYRSKAEKGLIILSFSAGLLIAQSTVQIIVVPVLCLLLIFGITRRNERIKIFARFLVAGIFPAFVIIAILVKNFIGIGLLSNSSLGGHALLLVVMGMNQWNMPEIRKVAVESGAPDWYLWCFDNPGKSEFPEFMVTMGRCMDSPTEMSGLRDNMKRLGADQQVELINRDIQRINQKSYLLYGVSPDMSTEWFAEYAKVSGKIASHVFLTDPMRWLNNSKLIHGNLFSNPEYDYILKDVLKSANGLFPNTLEGIQAIAVGSKWIRFSTYHLIPYAWFFVILAGITLGAARYQKEFLDGSTSKRAIGTAIVATSLIVLATGAKIYFDWFYYGVERSVYLNPSYLFLSASAIGLICMIGWPRITPSKYLAHVMQSLSIYMTLPLILILSALSVLGFIFCNIVGTENHRFFFQLTPYLFVLCGLLASYLFVSMRSLVRILNR